MSLLLFFWFQKYMVPFQKTKKNKLFHLEHIVLQATEMYCFGWLMVFNATSNNISVISWQLVLSVEKTGLPGENHRPDAWEEKKCLLRNLTAPNVIHQANDFNKSLKIFIT